ncbi:hypothetical protein ACKI1K_46560, partial [Streptomyces scabiei]|uniref:hypothetical protein n=1 Tax=Streptomyces scabiei TaxID=1930 RepID=UPI0038F7AE5C
ISVAQSESAIEQYQLKHSHFIDKRVNSLSKQVAKRRADIVPCPLLSIGESTPKNEAEESKQSNYFSTVKQATLAKHQ